MGNEQRRRYFARITVADEQRLSVLMTMDLDLFGERADERAREIDAFVTLEEVEMLVDAGFVVQLWDTPEPRRPPESIGFDDWRKETLAELDQQPRR
jgi:hypothetical protein